MKLFSKFKNLFVPKEEEMPRRKAAKKVKKKVFKREKKILKKRKKVVKKKKRVKKKIKKKVQKKIVKKKIRPKIKKKPAKKHLPLKGRLRQPTKLKKKSAKSAKRFFKEKEIGIIIHYFGKISVGIIKLKSTLRAGERIHIKGAHDDFTQTVKSIQINHKDVSTAGKGSEIGIKVPQPVHENDKVYKL